MAFQVPESKRSIAQNRFFFTVPGDDREFDIPKAKYLTTGQVEVLSRKGGEVKITDLLDLFDESEEAAKAVRTLDAEQLSALMSAWQSDSEVSVGESSASSDS